MNSQQQQLPDEIWANILSRLPRQELKKIRHTSKQIFHCGHYIYRKQTTKVGSVFHYSGTISVLRSHPVFTNRVVTVQEKSPAPYLKIVKFLKNGTVSLAVLNEAQEDTGLRAKRKLVTTKDGRTCIDYDAAQNFSSRKRYFLVA